MTPLGPFRLSDVHIPDPYPLYERYREDDPVHRSEEGWYLFRHADVTAVLSDRRYGRGGLPAPLPAGCPHLRRTASDWMVFMDPPRHTRVRALVARSFTPRVVERLRPRVDELAGRLVADLAETLAEDGRADLVDRFAAPFPILVISELLGVPADDRPWFRARAVGLQQATSARAARRSDAYRVADAAARELDAYFRAELSRRRAAGPTGQGDEGDLIAAMLRAAEEEPLGDDVLVGTCVHLLTAGHETTTNLLCKGLLALLDHPYQLGLLGERPELLPGAVEELVRYDGPVQLISRRAHEDAEIGGHPVRRGDKVTLVLGSANRDPRRFPHPDRLDIRRDARRHCGFGLGAHYCLGAPLARVEAETGLRRLLTGLPGLRLAVDEPDGPVRYADDLVFHGPSRMVVRGDR
ncbi:MULTISPECIES: cytochrome P450 [Streptomyces]|uniref:cytochrome P450 n=1 Tax=Streptomyces TaxID=1883 RepID=UPI00163C2CB5|nr:MULTISPECIES: cytochrome P450 [Streptomyces]MBC2876886.1 cytochrome P450 [Streptomyces sp. TYQ1024]UBI35916.1 cytochrome P450 [Streptomyces mobaraensis]UKW28510.1 cytochrome P450 [Streptomyces sp. TYQ1024]